MANNIPNITVHAAKMGMQNHMLQNDANRSAVNNVLDNLTANKATLAAAIERLEAAEYIRNAVEVEYITYLWQHIDWHTQAIFQLTVATNTLNHTIAHALYWQGAIGGGRLDDYLTDPGEEYASPQPGDRVGSPERYRYIHRNDDDSTVDSDYSEC